MRRLLICYGDSTNPSTHGGLSYSLLEAGIKNNLLHGGIKLDPQKLKPFKYIWNLYQFIISGKPGGFQYSNLFNKILFSQANIPRNEAINFLSHFPLLPPFPLANSWTVDFYIDATTSQIFNFYGTGKRINSKFQTQILKREALGYRQAGSIICRSQWAAESVINDYSINPKKVYVIPGGANINIQLNQPDLHNSYAPLEPTNRNPLRLGFLGKDWLRKGGPFLLQVHEALKEQGIPSIIRCIGPDKKNLPAIEAIESLGFINKDKQLKLFIEEIKSWHFGTLFSSAEAFGISNRECLLLGVPVMTHAVGGIPSTIPDDKCGIIFPPDPSAEDVASWIKSKINPYENYLKMRKTLTDRKAEFTWKNSANKLKEILT